MNTKQYYTAPSQEIFDDIKAAAITIWNTYDDTYGFLQEITSRGGIGIVAYGPEDLLKAKLIKNI